MANKSLLTPDAIVSQIRQFYFLPAASLPTNPNFPLNSLYCFLSKVEPWTNEQDPPVPTSDNLYLKQTFKNMFVVKQIRSSDICPVIKRKDWASGTIYDEYTDTVEITKHDVNGNPEYNYYVRNKYDQVFKCLSNNNGGQSTYEPFFEPGSYNTLNIYQNVDGYKWKYMYTIDNGLKIKFMDQTWMPIPIGLNTPNPLQSAAGSGDIEVINVVDGGSGYDPTVSPISIVIDGDGTGFSGSATVDEGVITDIIINSPGSNFSYANASVSSSTGSGAVLSTSISPVGGHGFNPLSELGAQHVMVTCEFNGSEDGILPTDIDFHQIGLLMNPTTISGSPNYANGAIYRTTTDFVVAPGFGVFTADEIIYQGSSLETSTFSARVLSFNTSTNVLYMINTKGTPTRNAPVYGNTSKTTRILLSNSSSDFATFSGRIIYIENRAGIQRSSDGIEQFRFVLGY